MKSGIAGRSAELVAALAARGHAVDVYVDEPVARLASGVASAHDFVWRHAREPYDLPVYQFGNASHHDYEWPYALRYPGLVVLHDTHLHHARAAALLRERRFDDYRREFAWNHPGVSPDLAEVAVAGFDSSLYYEWPMVRTLIATARLVAVHGDGAAAELRERVADDAALGDAITAIRLGEGDPVSGAREHDARRRIRTRYGFSDEAIVFAVFGGLTPEKRIDQVLAAFAALLPHAPHARLLLAGAPAAHYDVAAAIRARAVDDYAVLTGYLESDEALTDHLAACDVTLNLRWPTARETSGPWLRALAAGRATIITDLAHLRHVPSLDPRTWRARRDGEDAVCVAVDILDEDHSLRLAMRRLASDRDLRAALGRAAIAWWTREHTVEAMVSDYERVMAAAVARMPPVRDLPSHVRARADEKLHALARTVGVDVSGYIPGI